MLLLKITPIFPNLRSVTLLHFCPGGPVQEYQTAQVPGCAHLMSKALEMGPHGPPVGSLVPARLC